MWENAMSDNLGKVLKLIQKKSGGCLLDCGCGNGELTVKAGDMASCTDLYGVDLDAKSLQEAKARGIETHLSDINMPLPFRSNFFDIVLAHQVVEHLYDIDNFTREVRRVLKSDGYAIVSTENLSSWHNIFALILGYQDFSHHCSQFYIGNPLSPHRMERLRKPTEQHIKIFAFQSMKEIFEINGFEVERITGAGYYPLPSRLSSVISSLDPRHAHFITLRAKKRERIQ